MSRNDRLDLFVEYFARKAVHGKMPPKPLLRLNREPLQFGLSDCGARFSAQYLRPSYPAPRGAARIASRLDHNVHQHVPNPRSPRIRKRAKHRTPRAFAA